METGKRNGCLQSVLITDGIFVAIIFLIAAILVGVFLYHVVFRREKLTEFHSEDGAVSSKEGLDEKYELWFDGNVTVFTLYQDTATETAAVSFLCLVYDA